MQKLDSASLVEHIKNQTVKIVADLVDHGIDPQLAVILVGENPSSLKYVDRKVKASKEQGIIVSVYHLEEDVSLDEIKNALHFLRDDPETHGIIIQLPLPDSISPEEKNELINLIPFEKDVDGLRGDWQRFVHNSLRLSDMEKPIGACMPPTPLSVVTLLDWYNIPINNKKIVIVGNGQLVGQPLHSLLNSVGIASTVVDENTKDIFSITKGADILVSGTGQKDLVTYQWVKEGATVINCAMDVHEDSVSQIASAMSPAIGGIGPLTVAWLLFNVAQAAKQQCKHE